MSEEKDAVYWYQVVGQSYAPPADEWGESYGVGTQELHLHKVRLLKRTPKGVWLATPDCGKRFQLNSGTRKYACATIEEALTSFIKKKERQRSIYLAKAETANRFAGMAWLQLKKGTQEQFKVRWVMNGPSTDKSTGADDVPITWG